MRVRTFMGIVLLGVSIGLTPASAALLFSGGEDVDFICNPGGSCSASTSAAYFRSNWAREAYVAPASSGDPVANRFATPPLTPSATLWVHAQFCAAVGGSCNAVTSANAQMMRILDSNGNPTLIIRGTGTVGQVKISSRTAAGAFTDLATCSGAIPAGLSQIDFYVNYGAIGEVALYQNSVQVCDFTGNVTNGDGATTLNGVEFSSPATSTYSGAWSEVIVATTDTRAMARFTANTVGDGASIGFSGTNVCSAIWKTTTYNDASYAYSGSSNVTHECTINNSIPVGTYAVQGVTMSARTLVGGSGPQHFQFVTRTGGSDYTSPDVAPTNSFSNSTNYIQTVNPATGVAWTVSDLQNAGFNVGEKTTP